MKVKIVLNKDEVSEAIQAYLREDRGLDMTISHFDWVLENEEIVIESNSN